MYTKRSKHKSKLSSFATLAFEYVTGKKSQQLMTQYLKLRERNGILAQFVGKEGRLSEYHLLLFTAIGRVSVLSEFFLFSAYFCQIFVVLLYKSSILWFSSFLSQSFEQMLEIVAVCWMVPIKRHTMEVSKSHRQMSIGKFFFPF